MKMLLVIFCIITGLFGGGCALALGSGLSANPLMLIPGAVFLFNLLVILAVLGWADPWPPAFYSLAVVDFLIALGTLIGVLASIASTSSLLIWGGLMAAAFAIKGWLTWAFIRGRRGPAT